MYKRVIKPLFDFIGALLLLPVVLLVVVVFAPAIWLTDRGPVFYTASRIGLHCRPFTMFKLRSMYREAPDVRNADGSTFNAADDPRVTHVGRLLRKTSLDELPQLLNVLLGHMSFIGPRPTVSNVAIDYDALHGDEQHRYDVKPGITGYAQAYFRNSIHQREKFHWDAFYASHVSFLLDAKILLKTFTTVIGEKNINNDNR